MTVEDFRAHRERADSKGWKPPRTVNFDAFIGVPAPDREFLDGDSKLLPMMQVVLLGGDGGTGKSLLALQLTLACATVIPDWIGLDVAKGPVIYLSAEDDEDELHKRCEEICAAEPNADPEAGIGRITFICMAGEDATLGIENRSTGTVRATELYHWLDRLMGDIDPVSLILDNLADVYAGNENNRSAVKHFIGLLRKLAIKHECLVLLLGHPSLQGIREGTGSSGSTGWGNSVRVRLYLTRVLSGEKLDIETDPQVRVLKTMKSNYGPKGGELPLRWENHHFIRAEKAKMFDGWTIEMLRTLQGRLNDGKHRCDPKSPAWAGWIIAELMELDGGRDRPKSDCTPAQKEVRRRLADMLAIFERNGSILRVSLRDETARKEFDFYRGGAPA